MWHKWKSVSFTIIAHCNTNRATSQHDSLHLLNTAYVDIMLSVLCLNQSITNLWYITRPLSPRIKSATGECPSRADLTGRNRTGSIQGEREDGGWWLVCLGVMQTFSLACSTSLLKKSDRSKLRVSDARRTSAITSPSTIIHKKPGWLKAVACPWPGGSSHSSAY